MADSRGQCQQLASCRGHPPGLDPSPSRLPPSLLQAAQALAGLVTRLDSLTALHFGRGSSGVKASAIPHAHPSHPEQQQQQPQEAELAAGGGGAGGAGQVKALTGLAAGLSTTASSLDAGGAGLAGGGVSGGGVAFLVQVGTCGKGTGGHNGATGVEG